MTRPLPSTVNSSTIERRVIKAAAAQFGRGRAKPHYEHDHWWVVLADAEGDEVFYDVVDSEPSVADTGFSFERL